MQEIVIDCAGVRSTEEFWQRYLDAVKPEGAGMFGRNLDAFWDAIEGGGPGWPGHALLVFTHVAQLSELRTQTSHASFLTALKTIADEATAVRIKFID
ncbi:MULTISPECIES: barstar family protein [Asticcacaulis]|uniref:barstar family protein n=1 Tax=Asticcacaulis TaxID=76890 RepID=UPI001AE145AC|nr:MULTISPECIES: barstar family protein [Asticcacaulis]MBP2159563.1 ribonuclease inhibitor [Asticcacaulis solisilvae]MDR6800610.1 ribonuclease inhibitor [Asticcacaulis sp. BE141]